MRVISGSAKGRNLKSPGAATRPITDRAKESLFNILGTHVIDANVLDLFAGAGSVGKPEPADSSPTPGALGGFVDQD